MPILQTERWIADRRKRSTETWIYGTARPKLFVRSNSAPHFSHLAVARRRMLLLPAASTAKVLNVTLARFSAPLRSIAPGLRRVSAIGRLRRALRYLSDASYREMLYLQRYRPEAVFQLSTWTREDRYPHLFADIAARLGDRADLNVLSFGCSTGAEVRALRKALPQAHITGVDISERALRTARRRIRDPRVRFVQGSVPGAAGDVEYDLILCLAVLQRGELSRLRPDDCSQFISFERFERAVLDLDRYLKPNGLLALYHSNFRLADTRLAANYVPILFAPPHREQRALYGPDNRLIPDAQDLSILFVKQAAAHADSSVG
ncbi:class I SAM-dependent methyltransferase [Sphingomonas sp. MMS24-J45]|uniref:class I SAM-dependent methyltransferase n=1 Tax=Sphingomonas sp. MMS24-J45 TaxID=3238806 RepID=UPI00384AB633